MKRNIFRKKFKGVSFIELVIYIGMMAIILSAIGSFIYSNNKLKNRNQAMAEVDQGASEIMEIMTQLIRNANSINFPTEGSSSNSLSINTENSSDNPTVFELSGTNLIIKEGGNEGVDLNSDKVEIVNLNFKNMGNAGGKASIAIQFEMNYSDAGTREEFNYSKFFYEAASLR